MIHYSDYAMGIFEGYGEVDEIVRGRPVDDGGFPVLPPEPPTRI